MAKRLARQAMPPCRACLMLSAATTINKVCGFLA